MVINRFLDARRHGYVVAGGVGTAVSEKTMGDYNSGLAFLFAKARINGTTEGPKVVPDCVGSKAPWQKKLKAEYDHEKEVVREDPGDYIGNPMTADDVATRKAAAEKDARRSGQHNTTSGDMTPDIMVQLFDNLILRHRVAAPASAARPTTGRAVDAAGVTPPAPLTTARVPRGRAVAKIVPSRSVAHTDSLAYLLYLFAFVTLARPVTLINLVFSDITSPDPLIAENKQFMFKYVLSVPSLHWLLCASSRLLCFLHACICFLISMNLTPAHVL